MGTPLNRARLIVLTAIGFALASGNLGLFGVGTAGLIDDTEEDARRQFLSESLGAEPRWPFERKSANDPPKPFRFHPGPKSECGTFAITEFAVLRRFGSEEEVPSAERYYLSFDGGFEHNMFSRVAVGGSVFGGLDNSDRTQVGLRVRARYWLSKSASVDVAPGLVLGGKEEKNADFLPPGPILRVAVNPSASVGFVYQTFETKRQKSYGVERERASYLGAQLSSRPGVAGASVALIAASVWLVVILRSLSAS